ncbi:CPBP family intramembrane metalloprotease [Virgibacillus sp. AGTR]|uniref:CPBP family intramembrane glutamic endopeptidase n=1 Tax=Virgibacillus sp. AGTR TaxID=2812055 RepID=UPI001964AF5D|nr:CPBP family intramembrane glutamic endopeptidase [Virgibacillus sp. AGTR]MCC2251731.1 CPBP family intramembrane metalloprotease [Virgibacillus sp. AGTR]QRZ17103.1 CPBP family intramembrane metalloprotease [Virgibacillus sp. AGTR]
MSKKIIFLISSTFVTCATLAFIEHGLTINYTIKTISKISLFFLNIWLYSKLFQGFRFTDVLSMKKLSRRDWLHLLLLGTLSAGIVLFAYLMLQPFFDIREIKHDLTNRLGITATGFIFVGIYVTLINSLLEEYFFRGFIFFQLPRKLGYIISPLLFASYHIPMIALWFNKFLIAACFIGLWLIAIIFHKVNEKNRTIWFSWIIHICADIMIIIIGMTLFF